MAKVWIWSLGIDVVDILGLNFAFGSSLAQDVSVWVFVLPKGKNYLNITISTTSPTACDVCYLDGE